MGAVPLNRFAPGVIGGEPTKGSSGGEVTARQSLNRIVNLDSPNDIFVQTSYFISNSTYWVSNEHWQYIYFICVRMCFYYVFWHSGGNTDLLI